MRDRVVYEVVYRVHRQTTGYSNDPHGNIKDADTPAEAGRFVEEFLADPKTKSYHRIEVYKQEVRLNASV